MAQVVCTAGEEPAIVLAKFLADLAWADATEEVRAPAVAQSVSEAAALLSSSRIHDLLALLLISADTVLPKTSPQDLESAVSLLISLVPSAPSPGEVESSAALVASKLVQVPLDNTLLKLKLLFLLHNVVPASSPARSAVLLRIVKLASEARLVESVLPNLRRLDLQKQPWWGGLPKDKKKELYKAIISMLKDNTKGKVYKEYSSLSLQYLAMFSPEEAAEDASVREEAASAALDFIRSPQAFQSDILDVPTVHALEKDSKHKTLFQLLKIFLQGNWLEYKAFLEANPQALQTLDLDPEACHLKMRLLTLAAAAAQSLSAGAGAAATGDAPAAGPGVGEIRYALLQDMLQVKDDVDVEGWVVKAVSAGLIDAKMDQMRHTVIVSRASHRVFGTQQWQELRSRLLTWKENVSTVSKVASQARSFSGGTGSAAAGQGLSVGA